MGSTNDAEFYFLRDKSRACKLQFRKCLEIQNFDYDIWIEQKSAEFNWWTSGLNADKSGPRSLDAQLTLRPDIRDVVAVALDGLESALDKFYQIATSIPAEGNRTGLADSDGELRAAGGARPPSPWSDMADGSESSSSPSCRGAKEDVRGSNSDVSPTRDVYNEQRVYIETFLEALTRIHAEIKRSGLKFRNQGADEALKRAEEEYRLQAADLGEHQALQGENGKHERFRRYLTKLVLWNDYKHHLVQRLSCGISQPTEKSGRRDEQDREFLLQKKLLIVIRAYLVDPARLTTVQRRLINANVVRRNRFVYASNATKVSTEGEKEPQTPPTPMTKSIAQQPLLTDRTESFLQSSQPPPQYVIPAKPKQDESEAGESLVAQQATALESRFSITGELSSRKATKSTASTATEISARVGHLDYPECPAEYGQFPCPYCAVILTGEYTDKDKWRGHVARDLCPYICVFENCESPEEMFASSYEWMLHMARFHSETEWICRKCTRHSAPDTRDISISFQTPKILEEHLLSSHSLLDTSELGLLVDAGKRMTGIQKAKCPLCRPGLVTHERDKDDDNTTPPPIAGHQTGLIQLEEDEHIATHIHEFALRSFPSPAEGKCDTIYCFEEACQWREKRSSEENASRLASEHALASTYLGIGRTKEASLLIAMNSLADAYHAEGRVEEAVKAFGQILELDKSIEEAPM
ncbi:hypothetical protein O1611_g3084 [Lasiodiplodia mahajangana]|uniref:Uncharacterized protein n=1 Tax=Lasiodiplodia mahajangana TaxID=1108764 RepID=A0ACC2JTF2_9PEZI|nr:hypothetical protein O1611_g3084 [Lasiodiplodia mahajangana]